MPILLRSAALSIILLPANALAQANVEQIEQPFPQAYLQRDAGREVSIRVLGENPLRCSVVFDQASARVDLTRASSQDVGVRLNCNAPFRISARATNGAIRRIGSPPGDPRSVLPYQVQWPALTANGGEPVAQNFTASGEAWGNGLVYASGTSVIDQRGDLRIRWNRPEGLLAGEYRETFTVELESID